MYNPKHYKFMEKNDLFRYSKFFGMRKTWLIAMKTFLLLFFAFSIQLNASVLSQKKVSLKMNNVSAKELIKEIENQTNLGFIYNLNEIEKLDGLSIDVDKQTVEEVLDAVLGGTDLSYEIDKSVIIIMPRVEQPNTMRQQEKRIIRGKVTDEKGETLPGVNVILEGHTIGTVTNIDGVYEISVPNKEVTLSFSFMGFEKQVHKVPADQNQINVKLQTEVNKLDDVVITGVFTKARESFTGAATFIDKKQLEEFKSRDVLKTISNIDPSFNIVSNDEFGSDPNRLPEINIRGTSSVSNKTDQDLEALQDDEKVNLNTPLFILDGFEITLERMMDLNQDEILSITLLKDASATAIYGAQGANGVVVLTSIKPESGKLKVTYSSTLNLEVPDLRSYNLLDAQGKLELEKRAGLYDSDNLNAQYGLTRSYYKKLKAIAEGTDTYWLSKPVRVGVGQSHSVNLGGGDDAFRYSMNFQFKKLTGAMKGSSRDNFNGSINISYLFKKFKFSNSLSIGFNKSENSQYGSFSQYASLNPYWRERDEDGRIYQRFGEGDPVLSPVFNPLYNAGLGGYDTQGYKNIRENFRFDWAISDEFKVDASLGYTLNMSSSDKFLPPNHSNFYNVTDPNSRGSYDYRNTEAMTLNGQVTFNYAKVIDKHSFFAGINSRLRETQTVSYGVGVLGFAHDRMDFISMGSKYRGDSPSGSEATSRSVGVTFNGNYSYNNCYFADVSYRLDGSSSFGEDSRFAPFYSLGLGWNINRTEFFKENLPQFNNLRLRYSYGVTGSLQFSPYEAMTTYEYLINRDRYDGNLATSIRQLGNPDLKWQTTFQHNVGLDIGLWKNRLALNTNYYYKRTEDLITTVSLPMSNGYTSYTENMGDVLNQGIEVTASVSILRSTEIKWNMSGSVMHNKNKLLKLSDQMRAVADANLQHSINNRSTTPLNLYREGESMNALYVVPSLGIDPMTGNEMFLDEDGEITYSYPEFYRIPYGLTQPKINGRLSSNWTYKNLRLNVGFSFTLGANVYNSTLATKVETDDFTRNVDARVLQGRWQKPGDRTVFKSLTSGEPTRISSRFVQEERTLKLNSLSLDYRVPKKWLDRNLKLERVNLTYSTNDLLYFSSIERERGTGYPYALRHNFSLSIGF